MTRSFFIWFNKAEAINIKHEYKITAKWSESLVTLARW